jgi:hypothetical protein
MRRGMLPVVSEIGPHHRETDPVDRRCVLMHQRFECIDVSVLGLLDQVQADSLPQPLRRAETIDLFADM